MAIKTLFVTKLTDMDDSDLDGVGKLRYADDGHTYRYVKNRNATALVALAACTYDADNLDGTETDFYESINMPVSNDLAAAAGICVTAFGISGAKCYGWVLVEGFVRNVPIRQPKSTAFAIGAEMICENSVSTLSKSATGAAAIAPVYSNHFVCMEIIATDGTGTTTTYCDVQVKCL